MVKQPSSYYDGSRMFTWASGLSGLTVDQINFIISQLVALGLASLFRTVLHPTKTRVEIRHGFGLVFGLAIGYFCFGMQAVHLAGLPALCYIIIRTQDPQSMQRMVLAVALLYLSFIHLQRQIFDYGSYTLDITGPLMVITQKVTSLAYSIHDGLSRNESDLTESQKHYAVREIPSALEYFSYVLHFQALMAGPVLFYTDYVIFIKGSNLLKQKAVPVGNIDNNLNGKQIILEPSPCVVVWKKVVSAMLCALFFVTFLPVFPISALKDDDFVENTSLLYKFWYISIATACVRFKYYHAWLMADAICNNSGLGFSGYDENGKAKWDLISNVDILKFEFGTSLRESIEGWNIGTNRWLRMIVYERTQQSNATILTYALSALWHGFYPGYYLTFANGALFTFASRTMRRSIRQYFQRNHLTKLFYDITTGLVTRFVMTYITFTFVLLEFKPSIRLYLHMYLCLHVLAVVALVIVPKMVPALPSLVKNKANNGMAASKHSSTTSSTCTEEKVPITNGICRNHRD